MSEKALGLLTQIKFDKGLLGPLPKIPWSPINSANASIPDDNERQLA